MEESKMSIHNIVSEKSEEINVADAALSTLNTPTFEKPSSIQTGGNITLIPRPSGDPKDPLNWPMRKKAIMVAVLSMAMFAGHSAPLCGQLNLTQQAKLYHKTTIQMSYFNSAASGGLAAGGWLWSPLSHRFGRSSVILWCLCGLLATQIWAAKMTKAHQYWPYFMSRFMSGFFGQVAPVLCPQYLTDLFFLHQRGRAFTILYLSLMFGASAGPTFSGFISGHHYWPVEYWWSVAFIAVTIILVFLFLEETKYDRFEGATNVVLTDKFLKSRLDTFFPGTKVVPGATIASSLNALLNSLKIMVSPVVLIIACYDSITFGFYVALNALTPVWLQKPVKQGGYGFDVTDNAAFTFVHWIGVLLGLVWGQLASDKIPLWLSGRNSGNWKPEYRLYILWPTSLLLGPIGLGLIGAGLKYHLHWTIFGLGQIFVTIACLVSIPVTVNYTVECFRLYTVESVIPVASMRLFFGLSINFFINQWVVAVNIGWVYGMMAFFSVFAFGFLILLMWKGDIIRSWTPLGMGSSEAGEHVIGKSHNEAI